MIAANRNEMPVVPTSSLGIRLIAYLYFPAEQQPHRTVLHAESLDEGRKTIRRMLADHGAAYRAELWDEDLLVARLRVVPKAV